ncbi:YncE family protein [Actinokineospora globicatena]|uniref:YncE family protein n=1 Tax=Actinokineospora globicatena TaxID=103729 RepID=UPI0020A39BEA|nr:hypothetical protein [Actinokineospora globicatena]GLW79140.1 hypothetical protein Aglo01_36220 [Actinokineospora globicatena]GLW86450.1 hypothetical protein Aglo02_40890 [Actinokineospora globicatena]
MVTATPDEDGPVVVGQLELSLSNVHVFSVAAGALVPGASGGAVGSNLTDVSLTPDGATLFTAAGSRTQVDGFATTDLSRRGAYATGPYPNAVAVSPDGQYLATSTHTTGDDIALYRLGGTVPTEQPTPYPAPRPRAAWPGHPTASGCSPSPTRSRTTPRPCTHCAPDLGAHHHRRRTTSVPRGGRTLFASGHRKQSHAAAGGVTARVRLLGM